MALFPLFSRHFFPNYSFLLLFATVSIGLAPSGAVVQTFWKNLFDNELPQSDRSAQNFELFAELDEVDSVLTERMSAVISPPPSPAHPKFQKLYLDKKDKSSGQAHKPKTNKGPLHRLRTIFKRVLLEKKIDGIVQVYKKIKDSPGGWGVLVQKMFTEMMLAKQFGEVSAGESRKNCQTALQLIRDGGDEVGGVQLDNVKPFESTWSLVKSAAQSLVELFKGNAGDEKARMKRTETLLRVLKTFAMDGNALEGGAAAIRKQMLYLNADPAVKVPPSLCFAIFFLQTLIALQQQIVSNAASTSIEDATKRDEYPLEQMQRNAKRPPMNGTGGPSRVLIGIYIESMGNFQAADMSFDVDLYLYSHWRDPSLKHNNDDYVLMTDPKVRERIWLPDLYFANARTSKFHDVTIPNFSLFIDRDGNIAYSTRVTLNVACNLELANYPMDSQTCGIRMVSYAYVASQVNVSWFKIGATRYNPEIGLPEFKIVQLTPESCDGSYMYAIMSGTFKYDKFSCLEAVIHLNRQIGYHVVQSFIPTGLIVMISWVSFWIDRRAVPARVTLSFTTLLSLSTLGNGLRFNLPQVAYAKAIDFWFGSCMFFVFLSLVEFAAVNSYMREAEKYERLASYSAKKEMTNEEGNPWVYSDDDDFSSASRSPVLPFPSSHQKNSKKKSANNKSPKLNANNKNDYNNNNKKDEQENETKAIGAKLHNWTSNAIAIPSLFGRCADGVAAGDTKRSTTTHNQQQQNGTMRMIRHPTILAERILTVEHFEQLAEKRMSNSSQGKQSLTRGEQQHQHHPQHNHQLKQQQYASPVAAFEADLRSIDADENDSLLLMLSASSPAVPQRKRVISPLAKGGVTSALPPPPPPAPAFHCPPVPTMNQNGEGSPGGRNRAAGTPTPTMSRKRAAAVTPVPTIQPWPPSPMAQDANHKTPPAAPRRKEQQSDVAIKEAAVPGPDHLLMATTNHFLREGFRYSRKGLFIDKWSRLLFPLAFALWNTYYWTYYLWYIQRHHQGSASGGGG